MHFHWGQHPCSTLQNEVKLLHMRKLVPAIVSVSALAVAGDPHTCAVFQPLLHDCITVCNVQLLSRHSARAYADTVTLSVLGPSDILCPIDHMPTCVLACAGCKDRLGQGSMCFRRLLADISPVEDVDSQSDHVFSRFFLQAARIALGLAACASAACVLRRLRWRIPRTHWTWATPATPAPPTCARTWCCILLNAALPWSLNQCAGVAWVLEIPMRTDWNRFCSQQLLCLRTTLLQFESFCIRCRIPTMTRSNQRMLLLLSNGTAGLMRIADFERLQARPIRD